MLVNTCLSLFLLIAVSTAEAKVTLCEGTDVTCVRETLAELLSYEPIVGDGTDSFYYTVPVTLKPIVATTNTSCVINEQEFTGFKSAEILDFFQDDGYTVLTVKFPKVGANLASFTCYTFQHSAAPLIINSFGDFTFENVTITISWPGTEKINVTQASNFYYQEGAQKFGFEDFLAQAQQEGFEAAANLVSTALGQQGVVAREVFKQLGFRYGFSYALTNLVYQPNSPFAIA